MKLNSTKLIISAFILFAYISIGIFGLFQFNHMTEKPMIDCPYTQNGSSICENSLNHINEWRQFSNVVFPPLFILLYLVLGVILYFFINQDFLNKKLYFYTWKYYLYNKTPL